MIRRLRVVLPDPFSPVSDPVAGINLRIDIARASGRRDTQTSANRYGAAGRRQTAARLPHGLPPQAGNMRGSALQHGIPMQAGTCGVRRFRTGYRCWQGACEDRHFRVGFSRMREVAAGTGLSPAATPAASPAGRGSKPSCTSCFPQRCSSSSGGPSSTTAPPSRTMTRPAARATSSKRPDAVISVRPSACACGTAAGSSPAPRHPGWRRRRQRRRAAGQHRGNGRALPLSAGQAAHRILPALQRLDRRKGLHHPLLNLSG